MKREIKFRGHTGKDWVYGDLIIDASLLVGHLAEKPCILHEGFLDEVAPESVGQYTGLKDKNGKEIYEGDMVRAIRKISEGGGWYSEEKEQGKVIFDTHWGVKFDCRDGTQRTAKHWGEIPHTDFKAIEVIGNIHDKQI